MSIELIEEPQSAIAAAVITITRPQLSAALKQWEQNARDGKTRTHEETRALPVDQVANESSAALWEDLAALVQQSITAPAVGAPWPGQGGVYAGIVRNAGGAHHLIVATDPAGELEDRIWGKYGQDVTGATSKSDGAANTRAMAEAGSETAKEVLALQIDGHSDWFIPSQADQHVAFANCAELFDKSGYYWSSTQGSRGNAFVQGFEGGDSFWSGKDNDRRVRAFRAIQLQPLTT